MTAACKMLGNRSEIVIILTPLLFIIIIAKGSKAKRASLTVIPPTTSQMPLEITKQGPDKVDLLGVA